MPHEKSLERPKIKQRWKSQTFGAL